MTTSAPATAQGTPGPSNDRAAAVAYRQALAEYAAGNVKGALQSMQESYALSRRAELLFNLARLESELGQCQPALRDYDAYLREVPSGKYRTDAQRAIEELGRECPAEPAPVTEPGPVSEPPPVAVPAAAIAVASVPEASPALPAPKPPPAAWTPPAPVQRASQRPADASYWTTPRVIGWSAIATGALSGGAALYFLKAALSDRDQVQIMVDREQYMPDNPPWTDALESQHRNQRVAQVLGITAGALAASGAALLIIDPKSDSSPSASASATVAASPSYLGAQCTGSF